MKKYLILLLFSIPLLLSLCGCATAPEPQGSVHVVLLGGQSNMAGAGNYDALSDLYKARIRAVSSRVLLSQNGEPAAPLAPLSSSYQLKKRGFSNCFGPEMFMALTLAEKNPEQEYLFIKTSQGGTALYGAWNPEWSAEKAAAVETQDFKKTLKLYSNHLAAIRENLARLDAQDKEYKIMGMAWMQGENDAAKEISASSYEANLTKLINGYRTELNVPDLPFVCGQINSNYGDYPDGPDRVRQAFMTVAGRVDHVAVIRTKPQPPWTDFPKHEDQVHYNAEGQKRLGTAMANALLELSN